MKKLLYILSLTLASVFLMTRCQMDEPELSALISSSELSFEISQNPDDPNMVILESLTPDVIPLWITPMGRSTRVVDTVKLAFSGTYQFIYNAVADGGMVYGDTTTLEITTMNLSYVDDELWEYLTGGGPGNSKDWVLDTDAKYFSGGLSFFGTDNGWLEDGDYFVDEFEAGCYGSDCWTWSPDSTWLVENGALAEGDHGVMTFSLEGGAYFSATKPQEGDIEEEGTYFLDVDAKTLKITDASILRSYKPSNNGLTGISDWSNYTLFALTDDILRLGVIRDNDVDGEGDAMLVYNFISKEYSDNWVPEETEDPEPELPDGWMDDVSAIVDSELSWKLSSETPFNFAGLDGAILYEDWSSPDNYPDSTGFDSSVPSSYENFELTFNSEDYTVVYVDPAGNEASGTYTLDEDGFYTFYSVTPSFDIGSVYSLETSADNQWRLLKIETGETGGVSAIWVGVLNEAETEYFAYHLILQSDAGGSGTEVDFDNTKLVTGDLESNGNFRLELYNEYGSTFSDPPLDPTAVVFSSRIEVTFTLQGISLVSGATGSYGTAMGLADSDWSVSYWGGGDGETTVTGDGTYTVYVEPGAFDTALVFVLDITGLATDLDDIDAVTATVDSIIMY